jgi:ABC-type nickel/cobalt efflux system permease component RcnA
MSAFGFGAAHAFEPDHMAAVTTFVSRRPQPREAIKFGLQWAAGHSFSLLLMGSILFALKLTISESFAGSLEKFVGVALLLLGLWTLYQLRFGPIHYIPKKVREEAEPIRATRPKVVVQAMSEESPAEELPLFASPAQEQKLYEEKEEAFVRSLTHRHGSLWMGVLHGAAGTAAFVGEALVVFSQSYWTVVTYTLMYSLGVLLAMAAYAGALGGLIDWGGHKFRAALVGSQALAGTLACVVGVCWIAGIEIPWISFHH